MACTYANKNPIESIIDACKRVLFIWTKNIFIVNTFDKLDFEWNKIIIRHMNISEVIIFCNLLS